MWGSGLSAAACPLRGPSSSERRVCRAVSSPSPEQKCWEQERWQKTPQGKSRFPSHSDTVIPVRQLSPIRMGTAESRTTLRMTRTIHVLLGHLHAKVN